MNIITHNPVIVNKRKVNTSDYYLNGDGKGKKFLDKAKGAYQKVKDSGIIDSAKQIIDTSKGGAPADSTVSPTTVTLEPKKDAKKGMSKNLKIGLAIGGALLIGYIAYHIAHNKKSGKK